jgi:hypothetical protein
MSVEKEPDEINDFLVTLFVEKKEMFDKILNELNLTLSETFKSDTLYKYDEFCEDYLRLTKDFFKRHPEVDYNDLNMVSFYTNIIIGELFLNLKTKYEKNDRTNNNG